MDEKIITVVKTQFNSVLRDIDDIDNWLKENTNRNETCHLFNCLSDLIRDENTTESEKMAAAEVIFKNSYTLQSILTIPVFAECFANVRKKLDAKRRVRH